MRGYIICVTGNTATGTTTLTERIAEFTGWKAVYSERFFNQNPFFDLFLQDPDKWAFHNQVGFIAEYLRGYRSVLNEAEATGNTFILDYAIGELAIYTQAMKESGVLTVEEYTILDRLLNFTLPILRRPDLLIYLYADTETIMHRIHRRNRLHEREIRREYVETLQRLFDEFLLLQRSENVLLVDSAKRDFVHDSQVAQQIIRQAVSLLMG